MDVSYIDFGISNAKAFFKLIVMPNVSSFESGPTRQFAFNVAGALWCLNDWYWYDLYPKENSRGPKYNAFINDLMRECPHIKTLRDIANAAKHRGIGITSPA